MKNAAIGLFFVLAILNIACNNSANQTVEQQQAWDQMMAVHDDVMPKTSDLNRMTTQLRTKIAALDSTQQDTKNKMMDAIQALERAEEGMMSWMAEVQDPEILRGEHKTHAEIMRYLEEEKDKVDRVQADIIASLDQGKQLLESAPPMMPDSTNQQ